MTDVIYTDSSTPMYLYPPTSNELEDKLTESEEACQELEGESNELQTCMILVDGENARLTQDNENLTQNLTKKEEECKKLTTMVTKLMSELNAMSRHVGVEKEEKQAVGSELKTVEAERDKYLQQRDVARRSLAQRNMEYSALETQVHRLFSLEPSCTTSYKILLDTRETSPL